MERMENMREWKERSIERTEQTKESRQFVKIENFLC